MHTVGIDASRGFCESPTGTERYATEVVRGLVSRGTHHYRLYVRDVPSVPTPARADVVVLRPPRLWTHVGLAAELLMRPPHALFVPAHVLPWICRPPAVVTVHDLGFLVHPDSHPWHRRAYLSWSTRRHARIAAHVIADSKATRDDLVRRCGADPRRVTVSYLGVDDAMRPVAPPAGMEVLRRLGVRPDRPYLLHVGTLQPRKNLSRLVEAVSALGERHGPVELVLAGKPGWGDEDLRAVASRHGIDERVRILGYVARCDLPALYSGAEAVAVPSLYEGFGLPALEAMACGTPVAVSNTSSLPEVVGDAGLLFDPLHASAIADALDKLLSDADLRRRLGDLGRARAARFTWDACAGRIHDVLDHVLDEVPGPPAPAMRS